MGIPRLNGTAYRLAQKILHEKREATETHIEHLRLEGKQGIRYTAMIPDIPFLVLGLLSDVGWILHLIVGILYFCGNGFHNMLDDMALAALVGILFGVSSLIYLNKIHEKEIATKLQKDLSFGLTAYSGLAGAMIGIAQSACTGTSPELTWVIIGGFLNFAVGLPIYLSFKEGIIYGVR